MTSGRHAPRNDLLLAVGIAPLVILEVTTNGGIEPKAGAVVTELVVISGIAFRRSAPLLAAVLVSIGSIAEAAVGVPLRRADRAVARLCDRRVLARLFRARS